MAICCLSVACASDVDQGMDKIHSTNRATHRFEKNSYRYLRDDGQFGVRNANPGLAVGDWKNPSIPPKGDDRRRIQRAAMAVDGVQNVDVHLFGGHVAVKVTPQPGFPTSRYEELQEKVLRQISFEMPRYEVRVRVGLSKWNPLNYLFPNKNAG